MSMCALPVIACCAPLAAPTLSGDEAEATARLFKALGDPARLRLLSLIQAQPGHEACVCHLTEPLGLSQPTVSHHLKKLTGAGLLSRERRGVWAYYSLDRDAVARLGALVELGKRGRHERPAA